ncbi:hypothetical protein [Salinicola sp. DM10]|uniref:hypothetical protein n=1 Tax=Salinicola sp. DM10 TaxID=2815721 RepID=UPI001A8E4F00|nr:hypothetical protein [Salinicola sp. DM10]MCE3025761.1 hypothetical protein [Salinicola sp. DM10]
MANKADELTESLVQVIWIDTFGCPAGWEFREELNPGYTRVKSVGTVMAISDDFVCLAPHVSQPAGDGATQVAGHITVPRRSILEINKLELGRSFTAFSCLAPE